jgi:hypothetical protein
MLTDVAQLSGGENLSLAKPPLAGNGHRARIRHPATDRTPAGAE